MKGAVLQDNNIITVRDLTKRFGKFYAVNHINFSIKQGEILGFLGPNGAGKTTTIKMITGLLRITSGDVFIKGLNVKKKLRRIKTFTGYMSQKFSLYPTLTGSENIAFFGGISGLTRREIKHKIKELSNLFPATVLGQQVREIPPGIKQQIALYTCLMSDPEIILLDEPTSGVDPENRRRFWMQIYDLKKKGKTVLVTTHNLDEAEYADRILIIHKGHLIIQGEPEALVKEHKAASIEDLFKQAVRDNEAH